MGDQFSVQLEQLDSVANKRLPGMANTLAEVLANLNRAMEQAPGAFTNHPSSDRDLFQGTRNDFQVTTDFLQQVLQDNVGNLELASKALREIASRYRQADGQG
ncbi:uncharacterized protein YukE [Saccharothrix ecbatanensis]|jgi:uncharacterized protein YukE|uniref:Uncharacterized protein YukE n=1 Tax=Saccharothrix ecbatanensis TaxID=1105145 RepID=A0A7W9HSS9_9PSEU|nr:hypothetical protein [Saccharothrix ecbatanensis]MBB5807799.1 uncharacterized protein YukE [Saccharothrix ecbatanensis]